MSASYDAFISYNRADSAAVERAATFLKARGLRPFLDKWSSAAGVSWPSLLEKSIDECGSVVVFIGPRGLGSWQQRESFLALERQTSDPAFPVIPALLPGADDPALGFLGLNTWVDLRDGLDDGPAIERLAAAIRGEAPEAIEAPPDPRVEICPYRGLEPFREEDAPFLFGREAFTTRLADKVSERAFVAVVGASGSGKSSIVRAGLTPLLRRGWNDCVWDIVTIRPGAEPFASLARGIDPPPAGAGLTEARAWVNAAAARLRDGEVSIGQLVRDHLDREPGTDRLMLVVDQFEELATLCVDEGERRRFVEMLLEGSAPPGPMSVVITLRSDFYGEVVRSRELIDRLEDAVVNVGPLSRVAPEGGASELESAIRRPAEAVGLGFESGLPDRILGDVGDEPGNLPLLEFLLTELWRRRAQGRLRHADYDAIGGVGGAIATRADAAFTALSEDERQAARRLFLSLVRPGDGAGDTRVRAAWPSDPAEAAVAERFAGPKLRLLVSGVDATDGPFVDLAHEALIRSWERLRRWIERNREQLRARGRVAARQRRWREEGGPDALLLPRGVELEEGRRLLQTSGEVPVAEIRAYIEASAAAADAADAAERAAAEERERLLREKADGAARLAKQRGWITGLSVAALLVTAALGLAAYWQRSVAIDARTLAEGESARAEVQKAEAERQAAIAEAEADLAVARNLAAVARRALEQNPGESSVAAMIAVDSLARRDTPEANAVLRDALSLAPLNARTAPFPWLNAQVTSSRDGKVAAYASNRSGDGPAASRILVLDEDLEQVAAHAFGGLVSPSISRDGRWLVNSGWSRRLLVVDAATGDAVLDEPMRFGVASAFSADGATLYAASQGGEIHRWATAGWRELPSFRFAVKGASAKLVALAATADGSRLFLRDMENAVLSISTQDGAVERLPFEADRLTPWPRERYPQEALAAPDGPLALIYDNRGAGTLWDAAAGRAVFDYDDGTFTWSRSKATTFSADGGLIARGTDRGTLVVRRAQDGAETMRREHGGRIAAVVALDDPVRIVTAGEGGAAIWSGDGEEPLLRVSQDAEILAAASDPADGTLLLGDATGRLLRVDPVSGAVLAERVFPHPVSAISSGGAGGTIAVALKETDSVENWTEIAIFDREAGRELSRITWNGGLSGFRLSADGRLFAAHDADGGEAIVWDAATGDIAGRAPLSGGLLGFSSDGGRLLTRQDALVSIDLHGGPPSAEMGEPGGVRKITVAPGRRSGMTSGDHGDRIGWDFETGARSWRIEKASLVTPDGETYAVYDAEAALYRVFRRRSGAMVAAIPFADPGDAALSEDGARLILSRRPLRREDSQFSDCTVELWDLAAGSLVRRDEYEVWGPQVRFSSLSGDVVALSGSIPLAGGLGAMVEAVAWENGASLWRETWEGSPWMKVHPAGIDAGAVLIQAPTTRELRDVLTGARIWSTPGERLGEAAFVPDGGAIAISDWNPDAGDLSVIRILDRASGGTVRLLQAGGGVRGLDVTVDGAAVVAAVSSDQWYGVRAWRISDGALLAEIPLDGDPQEIAALADPDRVLVRQASGAAEILDLARGERTRRLVHARDAGRVALAAEADRAVTWTNASLRYWNTVTGEELAHRVAHGAAESVTLSPDGTRVAYRTSRPRISGGGVEYEAVAIWEPGSDQPPAILPVEDVASVFFDPTGRLLALTGRNGAFLRLVDVGTLLTKLTLRPMERGAFVFQEADGPGFTGDGRHVLVIEKGDYSAGGVSDRRYALRAFDIADGREVARVDVAPWSSIGAAGPGGVHYLSPDRVLRWFDLPPPSLDEALGPGPADSIHALPGSSRLIVRSHWQGVRMFDLADGAMTRIADGDDDRNAFAAAVDPAGGRFVLSRSEPGPAGEGADAARINLVTMHDARTGEEIARQQMPEAIWGLEFAGGGDLVLLSRWHNALITSDDQEGDVHSWNWRTGELKTLVSDNPVAEMAVSADGSRFATSEGSTDTDSDRAYGVRQVRLWNAEGGPPLLTVGNELYATNVALSADGRRLAIFDVAYPVQGDVLEIVEGEAPRPLLRIERSALAEKGRPVGFARDGEVFVLREDVGVRLYDLETGEERRFSEPDPVGGVALSPDGSLIAMAGEDFVSVWDVGTGGRLARFAADDPHGLVFAGEGGRELVGRSKDQVVRFEWRSDRLTALACTTYASDEWFRGRARLTGNAAASPCETAGGPAQ